jgi:hypothetical protein
MRRLATPATAGFGDDTNLSITLQEIRQQQQAQAESPSNPQQTGSESPAPPKDRLSSLLPVLLPIVLGVAVLAAVGLFASKVLRMRRLGRVAVAGGVHPAAQAGAAGSGTGNILMGEQIAHTSQQPDRLVECTARKPLEA